MTQRISCVVDVIFSSFFFLNDGMYQISVTNIDHPSNFKAVWLFYLR